MSEKHIDVTERLQQIGKTVNEYRESLMSHFKDMDVNVKEWNFTAGKLEKEYVVEVNVKLSVKPK
jgi:hypothetical protein